MQSKSHTKKKIKLARTPRYSNRTPKQKGKKKEQ